MITFEETVQTVLNLLRDKEALGLLVKQQAEQLKDLKEQLDVKVKSNSEQPS